MSSPRAELKGQFHWFQHSLTLGWHTATGTERFYQPHGVSRGFHLVETRANAHRLIGHTLAFSENNSKPIRYSVHWIGAFDIAGLVKFQSQEGFGVQPVPVRSPSRDVQNVCSLFHGKT